MLSCNFKNLCIFCGSIIHYSQNCNLYISNEDRQIVLRNNNICTRCVKDDCHFANCDIKCYICFASSHHTVYCPDRLKAPDIFPPNIDNDLLPRFIEALSFEEQYSMLFSFQKISNAIKLKHRKIKNFDSLNLIDTECFIKADVVIAEKGYICSKDINKYLIMIQGKNVHSDTAKNEQTLKCINQINFWVKYLKFQRVSIPSDIFLRFLSTKTTYLECREVFPGISFRGLLKTAPYLEVIDLDGTNIKLGDTWPDDLLCYNRASKLERIRFVIAELNFSSQSLWTLIIKKSAAITLIVRLPRNKIYNKQQILEMITSKFFPYFVRVDSDQSLKLLISYTCNFAGNIKAEIFNMKTSLIA